MTVAAAPAQGAGPTPVLHGPGRYLFVERVGAGSPAHASEVDAARLLDGAPWAEGPAPGESVSPRSPGGAPLPSR